MAKRAFPTSSITQFFSLTIEEEKKSTSQITKTRYLSVLKSELGSLSTKTRSSYTLLTVRKSQDSAHKSKDCLQWNKLPHEQIANCCQMSIQVEKKLRLCGGLRGNNVMMRRNCCLQKTVCEKEDSPYSLFRAHKASVTAFQ